MYTVKELRKNSWEKLRSAGDLLKTRKFNNAVYLCGYAVELGLKAHLRRSRVNRLAGDQKRICCDEAAKADDPRFRGICSYSQNKTAC